MTALKSSPLYKKVSRLVAITLGCVVYAAGIALFLDPNSLAPGGATGIAIMISHLTNIPTGTVVLCLNIPLLALGVWKFGREFLISTVYATGLSSVMINWFAPIGALTDNLLIARKHGRYAVSGVPAAAYWPRALGAVLRDVFAAPCKTASHQPAALLFAGSAVTCSLRRVIRII